MKQIVILGAGESGVGAATLALHEGYRVFVSDKGSIKEKYKTVLQRIGVAWEEGNHDEKKILEADEIIKSPGIPAKAEIIKKAVAKGIPVISEIEFAGRHTHAKKICVTGSNGKTTTTMLAHHILTKAGFNAGLAGNVGQSFALQVAEKNHDYYVLELSSFQLDDMYDFKADIAILTNITPDHLDRYEYDMQRYADSKFRITQNQSAHDAFIYCADDEVTAREITARTLTMQCYPFSITHSVSQGACLEHNQLIIHTHANQTPFNMSIFDLALQGKHNLYNSMAAGIAASLLGIRKDIIRESLSDFQNIEHRLEYVATVNGIDFINDSKATNVNSTWFALESMNRPVVWIVGGVDKGNDYKTLKELVKEKVKSIVCLGTDNKKIIREFSGIVPHIAEARSAAEAVRQAYLFGRKGDVVLLSPCCASFDLFENYEDRGRQFKNAVRAL